MLLASHCIHNYNKVMIFGWSKSNALLTWRHICYDKDWKIIQHSNTLYPFFCSNLMPLSIFCVCTASSRNGKKLILLPSLAIVLIFVSRPFPWPKRVSNKSFGIGCVKRYQLKQEAMILYFAALKATKEKLSIVQVETIVMDIERIWRHVWAELWFWNRNACQISKL